MVPCGARDVGSGHVNPSKEIEQDKIEVFKYTGECTFYFNSSFRCSMSERNNFYLPDVKLHPSLAIFFTEPHTASFISFAITDEFQ